MAHRSVLLQEAIDGLEIHAGETVVDGTINGGGHSEEILKRFSASIRLIGVDLDTAALERARKRLAPFESTVDFLEGSFRKLSDVLRKIGVESVHRVLLDLGWSADQFEESGRGFSFRKNEKLLMTYSRTPAKDATTARDIVNHWSEENIALILKAYGEERYAKGIAGAIVEARVRKPLETTYELVAIIESAVPASYKHLRLHPATKTFQALRMAVNDEINTLRDGLTEAIKICASGGRIAVISFHSVEDRVVKHIFREAKEKGRGILINKKPLRPSRQETIENPRSRSAKLRIFEIHH